MTNRTFPPMAAVAATTFPWPPVLFALAVVFAGVLTAVAPLPWPGLDDAPAHVIGIAFGVCGVVLIVSGFWALRAQRTTYLPHRPATTLVTTGPYIRFRNPIYLGEVLLLLYGAQLTLSIWFVAAALLFASAVTLLQIIPEERHLEAAFGEQYLAYKARSRRWI
jgi:protein-S-isoprenylcysteine O-methyltransferase Ste14